ncbi:phage portal protein [Amycolatopsis sp. NPDC058340]|uniref:phage portal protein n=1 Tax=Amycolatopsis sp. NPDC058340 TaxID=3346453 RepID=UPI003647C71C
MASLLGGVARKPGPRNESPVPLVSRAAANAFGGNHTRRDARGQLDMMAINGTIFGIVNKTSTAVAKTVWKLYRKAKSGKDEDRVEVTRHAALDVINRPNKFFTRMELFETAQQHLDLPGEAALVIGRHRASRLPLELWPVRPDRLDPVPHPTDYLAGWIYTSPDGERVPLAVDEVLHVRMPNPVDPYRGLGPVGTILVEARSAQYAAEWNASFFYNSAEPGGIIEVEKRLTDDEFDELSARWDEQHRGVARAHRVAILEQGKWIDRKYSQREMEFSALRGTTRDAIMEAYGFPKSMLGITEDVNRAVAEAGKAVFAEWLTVPRLDRWRDALNAKFLPLFGDTAHDLEFDYDSPVPSDAEAENAERSSRAEAVAALVEVGFDGNTAAKAYELPDGLVWHKPADESPAREPAPGPATAPAEPGAPQPADPVEALFRGLAARPAPGAQDEADVALRRLLRNAPPLETPPEGWPERNEAAVDEVDLAPVQEAWAAAVAALVETWNTTIVAKWITALIDAIKAALGGDGDRADLGTLTLDIDDATTLLADAMAAMGETAAGHAVDEAAEQDVDLTATWPTVEELEAAAREIADFEARRYALTAGREAARVAGPEPDEDVVAEHMRTFLDELSDAPTETALGSALTDAQNQARAKTLSTGPVGALYASEQMDRNTCGPCREVHGRWIANTDDQAPLNKLYPAGGYIDCLGRWRCRGTVVGVWRPKTTKGGQ